MIKIKDTLEVLQKQAPHWVDIVEKIPGLWQVLMPIYFPDGDIVEVYISPVDEDVFEITDYGLTLMRLSCFMDVSRRGKKQIIDKIFLCNSIQCSDGVFHTKANVNELYCTIIGFIGTILAVNSVKI